MLPTILTQRGLPLSQALAAAAALEWSPAARCLLDAVAKPSRKGVIARG